jgi:hypothetical protein
LTNKPVIDGARELGDSLNPKKISSIMEGKIKEMDREAKKRLEPMTRSLELAQNRYNQANIEVTKYLKQKQQGTLIDNDLLEMAQDERQESLAEIQRLQGDIKKVQHWGTPQEAEMRVLENRALNGDYMSYIKLRDYNTKLPPTSQLK